MIGFARRCKASGPADCDAMSSKMRCASAFEQESMVSKAKFTRVSRISLTDSVPVSKPLLLDILTIQQQGVKYPYFAPSLQSRSGIIVPL